MAIFRRQFDESHLISFAVENNEGVLNKHGVFCTFTGKHTGRSPNAKRIVSDSVTADAVDWNNNIAMVQGEFDELKKKFDFYLQYKETFVQDVYAVRDQNFQMPVRIITKLAKHSLFARNMFIPADKESLSNKFFPEWTVYNIPEITNAPSVAMSFKEKIILISGTSYAGEIKKSVFTVLNFDFLNHGLPMHCSINVDKDRKNPAIFFGLSGTGKTTLSADASRVLIGDDEHGWSDLGLTNFEGGCYAKTINLSKKSEPQIWKAAHTPGCMLENVHVKENGEVDFNDTRYTENSRCSYPTSFIDGADEDGYVTEQPKNVIMLTCDAFGVLPAVMKLTPEEAVKQFLIGYTAKVAGTEKGVTEPKATFSPCFGLPFMPRNPKLYGIKLKQLVEKNDVNCWLVNTGWTGGPYGIGKRMPISVTRHIISLILDESLASCKYQLHSPTGFTVPLHHDIDQKYIFPEKSWGSINAYNKKLKTLLEKFAEQGH